MSLIPFPNVPNVPGVPAIPRSVNFPAVANVALGAVQGALWRMFQVQTQWGIFDSSGRALGDVSQMSGIVSDTLGLSATLSTGSVDYSKETKVSDFPIERGSFANYNKVELPSAPTVTLCFAGSESDRRAFLEEIDLACKSTDLYDVVTPEKRYIQYSLERYNYQRRSERGATLLIVEISLREIRQVSAQYVVSNRGNVEAPKDAGASPTVAGGTVQPKTPDVSTLKKIGDSFSSLGNTVNNYLQGIIN